MSRKIKVLGALIALTLINGCAIHDGRPAPANINVTDEQKLKSVKHWEVVADDVSDTIAKAAINSKTSVYIKSDDKTAFDKVFPSYLRSKLLAKGVNVSASEQNALRVDLNVEAVRHVILNRYKPGSLSALAAGVLVLRDSTDSTRATIGSLAALAIGADVIASYNEVTKRPSTEVVLTTSIQKDSNYLVHRTDAYYIDSVDSTLFNDYAKEIPVLKAPK